jgi:predicted lipid-binding transport protein (Tim44 family)
MSPQLLEILIFGAIALVVIGKLISTLGQYNENDVKSDKSYFGEKSSIKDITDHVVDETKIIHLSDYYDNGFIDQENKIQIEQGIENIQYKLGMPLDLQSFIKKSKAAFEVIIEYLKKSDKESLENLVDKRFIPLLTLNSNLYKDIDTVNVDAIISEAYSFGNNCFIKVKLFNKENNFQEYWIFTKTPQDATKAWYLSNIERD